MKTNTNWYKVEGLVLATYPFPFSYITAHGQGYILDEEVAVTVAAIDENEALDKAINMYERSYGIYADRTTFRGSVKRLSNNELWESALDAKKGE
jgi:hypothetical protein